MPNAGQVKLPRTEAFQAGMLATPIALLDGRKMKAGQSWSIYTTTPRGRNLPVILKGSPDRLPYGIIGQRSIVPSTTTTANAPDAPHYHPGRELDGLAERCRLDEGQCSKAAQSWAVSCSDALVMTTTPKPGPSLLLDSQCRDW